MSRVAAIYSPIGGVHSIWSSFSPCRARPRPPYYRFQPSVPGRPYVRPFPRPQRSRIPRQLTDPHGSCSGACESRRSRRRPSRECDPPQKRRSRARASRPIGGQCDPDPGPDSIDAGTPPSIPRSWRVVSCLPAGDGCSGIRGCPRVRSPLQAGAHPHVARYGGGRTRGAPHPDVVRPTPAGAGDAAITRPAFHPRPPFLSPAPPNLPAHRRLRPPTSAHPTPESPALAAR
jgi:hypothetical protein